MTPLELAEKCADAIGKNIKHVQLVIPRRAGGSARVRVFGGQKGVGIVWGELCCENADGRAVVWVDATTLLAWLTVYAGVRVEAGAPGKTPTHDPGH